MKKWMSALKKASEKKSEIGKEERVTVTETDENGITTYVVPKKDVPYLKNEHMGDLVEFFKREYPDARVEKTFDKKGRPVTTLIVKGPGN